jgi:threonine dehydratase
MPALPSTLSDLEKIHTLIKPFINKTPVLQSDVISELCGGEVFFKCENFQKIGAFKARGAVHAVKNLLPEQLKNGVATHSSGNHAQALAYAANLAGCKAYIVMPKNSAQVKMQGVKRLGAEVIECDNNLEARESTLKKVVEKTGAFFIPPFDHEWIIGGQGTAAKELIEEIHDLDFIVAPCGGGGLLSGTALTTHIINKKIKVIGAEPENAGDAAISFKTGNIEKNDPAKSTIADGLRTSLGEITIKCIRDHVSQILTVSENEIIEAMKITWAHLKITAEPSSVVPLAVLLKNKSLFKDKRTGIIISGGNVDFASVPFLTA